MTKSRIRFTDDPALVVVVLVCACGWLVVAFWGLPKALHSFDVWNSTGTQNLIYVLLFVVAYRTYIESRRQANELSEQQERTANIQRDAALAAQNAAEANLKQIKLDAVRDALLRFFSEPLQSWCSMVYQHRTNLTSNAAFLAFQKSLPQEQRQQLVRAVIGIGNYFGLMGTLVRLGILEPTDCLPMLGAHVITFYTILSPLDKELGLSEEEGGNTDFKRLYELAVKAGYKDGARAYADAIRKVVQG